MTTCVERRTIKDDLKTVKRVRQYLCALALNGTHACERTIRSKILTCIYSRAKFVASTLLVSSDVGSSEINYFHILSGMSLFVP